jgi:hypothetical protein
MAGGQVATSGAVPIALPRSSRLAKTVTLTGVALDMGRGGVALTPSPVQSPTQRAARRRRAGDGDETGPVALTHLQPTVACGDAAQFDVSSGRQAARPISPLGLSRSME